ncbi:MAG: flippase-like domain-containing protein [Leptospirales bacterium]|nr:flippase-like domain-containing protein [Leptospirales bacterium]
MKLLKWIYAQRKVFIGLLMSAAAIFYIYKRIDLSLLLRVQAEFHLNYLPLYLLIFLVTFLAFALRWWFVNESKGSVWTSFKATLLASGGNALLPARGGDVLRMLYFKQKTNQPVSVSAVRAIVEKGLDLPILLSTVMITFSLFQKDMRILLVPAGLLIVIVCILVLIKLKPDLLTAVIHRVESFLKRDRTEKSEMKFLPSTSFLTYSFLMTAFMWYVPVLLLYGVFLKLVGLEFSVSWSLLLILFAALGVALPSAPSGLGVFHASIASAFELLGYSIEVGLFYATILHALLNIPPALLAIVVYLMDYDTASRNNDTT